MDRSVFDIANWFLTKEAMTPKKLQKLVYYYFAWGQALLKRDMIKNCRFEAWVHGPVNKTLYNRYKKYGGTNIPKASETVELSDVEEELLESVWLTYGDKSANELEALTHLEKPWREARQGCGEYEPCAKEISKKTMRDFYLGIYSGGQGE